MLQNELTDQELMIVSKEDEEFFKSCIDGLPDITNSNGVAVSVDGPVIPYGSGPHIIRHLRDVLEIVKPKSILEIGFNIGYSSAMFLNLCDAHVLSCDISTMTETIEAFDHLERKFPERFLFAFRWLRSFDIMCKSKSFDLCFIDGGHDEASVTKDISLCKQLNIPYLLFDDVYSRFGPGVLPAIEKFPDLILVKDMYNLRLYKFKNTV